MNRAEAKRRAEALVAQMTVEEKASQLKFDSPAIERLNIPEYNWWNEALHGVARAGTATMFPQAIGMAASFDEDLLFAVGDCIGTEGRAKYNMQSSRGDRDIYKGLTFWSPNVNIFRDPRWGRGHETYGEDPYLTSRMGVQFVKGVQGDGEYLKAAACAKHFAVHSGPEPQRHTFNAIVSRKDMEETYLPAFEACVKEANVEAVMGAYNRTNGEPCCAHEVLMNEYLRGKWGFEGHYVSDCWAIKDFHENHKVTTRPEESVKLALELGCDVNCGCTYQRILDAHAEGILDEKYIDRACVRLFTTRILLGLFDKTELDDIPYNVVECKEHIDLSHKATKESLVLLKNNGILPLNKEKIKNIAVIGPNANSRDALVGNYHGTSSRYITVLEGIQDYLGDDARVWYSEGCHKWRESIEFLSKHDKPDELAEAQAICELSDVVILVLGLDEWLEGEEGDAGPGDKTSLLLPAPQRMLMDAVLATGKPVILLNMTGSAMDLRVADEKADAVVQCWYPGARGGKDIAELLFGEYAPSGKLPLTFYESTEDLPDFCDYSMKNRTYRYFEGTPLYPFGFGLTYGDCYAQSIAVAKNADIDGNFDGATLKVNVRNDGKCAEDVLQIYIKDETSSFAVRNYSLCGFKRVSLAENEEKEVEIVLNKRAFTSVDEDGNRAVFGNRFTVFAAFSQPDARSEELTGHKAVSVEITL
ncbi:MAG: glycoside hydrolase family 3 C-terminal domain-containing protein [Clostridia bacterium]|nr:glycoside hydrolase family 3 C-terminal domain-containing protein [Clostridia bacterium]